MTFTIAAKMTLDDLRAAIAAGKISHTRAGDGCWRGLVMVYAHDAGSPSGVLLWESFEDTPELEAILGRRLSPLSPTER